MIDSDNMSKKAADFVDSKLQLLADTLDGTAGALHATSAIPGSANFVDTITSPLKSKLERIAENIRSQHGAELIEFAKKKMVKSPVATVGLGAALGAVVAQVAIVAIRAERKRLKPVAVAKA